MNFATKKVQKIGLVWYLRPLGLSLLSRKKRIAGQTRVVKYLSAFHSYRV